jgi:hypothetical protein
MGISPSMMIDEGRSLSCFFGMIPGLDLEGPTLLISKSRIDFLFFHLLPLMLAEFIPLSCLCSVIVRQPVGRCRPSLLH